MFLYKNKNGRITFKLLLGLHKDNKALLEFLISTFKTGYIRDYKNASFYSIENNTAIKFLLFSIFEEFNLNSCKYLDYLLFKEAFEINELLGKKWRS